MRNSILVLVLGVALTGCLKTRSEIAGQEDRKTQQVQVQQMQQTKAADQEARLQEMENNFRQLNGRLEALEYRLTQEQEARNKEVSEKGMTQKQLLEQMKLFEESLVRMEQKLAQAESRPAPTPAPVGSTGGAAKASKEAEPESWVEAEALFNGKDWKKSILAYQRYRDENPKGKHFADATYKIGVSFQELGKKEEAKAFFDEVLEKFPKSPTARKASYRLKNL